MRTRDDAVRSERTAFMLISFLSLLGGCALVAVRFALTDRFFYFFLIWNLVLALVPYGISVAIFAVSRGAPGRRRIVLLSGLSLLWLLFYPNAPYIFTDLIHVVNRTFVRSGNDLLGKEILLWFDLALCSAFAYLGHTVGLISIDLVLRSLKGVVAPAIARSLVAIAIAIAGFGIYVGRFARFNSWDLIVSPIETAARILPWLVDANAILLSAAFSAFILITYVVHHLARRT
ncbi:MAG: hypothetical protein A2Z99_11535 [Treponema sp. GWB1_62_6]|nr:MAG: hypothetical protein A2Z99_11535 [Treponema sp. GWB1_62_6]OHE69127.1 MAG: hypothetical protein A2001_12870 [Treponema sp. GWC1_61_84]OHE75413.1 MAG: hypothetical protein A2413_15555 [Treponema sp. RIFOXYC1_FULL_61_9]HCM27073.1 hypothetical protein [Treponema sp.]